MLVGDVFRLQKSEPPHHSMFFGFANWNEVLAFSGSDEGEEMRPFVNLVEQNGAGRLWAAIKGCCTEQAQANVSISTAHKSKGSEWKSVHVSDDFLANEGENLPISQAEARLFYVAITRAKEILSIEPRLLAAYTRASRFVDEGELLTAKKAQKTKGPRSNLQSDILPQSPSSSAKQTIQPQLSPISPASPVPIAEVSAPSVKADTFPPSRHQPPTKKSFWARLFS